MLDNLDYRRELILEHYENPNNKIEVKKIEGYKKANISSNSCIDNITAFVKTKSNKIIDIKFNGLGCAIATSSTDIMANQLKGMDVKKAKNYINSYLDMIDGKSIKKDKFNELIIFENVNRQMNRIKCAKIGIEAIKKAIE
jgi:nitrogen fixation NifU-like protein